MHDLPTCVNTGVSASSDRQSGGSIQVQRYAQRLVECFLDGASPRLSCPAREVSSVVSEVQPNTYLN